ncbi:MAG: endo alpha-1,4 polygalactosaminidase, partial [Oceanospirillum sp.]|nr:endo alpha-1,4 polygalactosaminidase [Oceanospirillum sp.]
YDFSVNEQCFEYNECDTLKPFIDAGKPVLNAEYKSDYVNNTSGARDAMCAESLAKDFSSLVLPLDLDDSSRYSCL